MVERVGKRMCFGFCCELSGNLREESGGAISFWEAGDCVSDFAVTE